MVRCWISIGSNQDPERHFRAGLAELREHFDALVLSPVYLSEAVGFAGPPFLNAVVGVDSDDDPRRLAVLLKQIETNQGRVRGGAKFASRTLDLDLLTWGAAVVDEPGLRLPRDEILRYAFVLKPLADVAAAETHPLTGSSYAQLWREFDGPADLQPYPFPED